MENLEDEVYSGDGKCHRAEPLEGAWGNKEPYIASQPLINAINTAIYLRRPLLLEGDPGCGKTRLAYSVAYELGYPLKECYINSTTKAKDLFYKYDAVKRLYDLQIRAIRKSGEEKSPEQKEYVKYGKLGEAIELSTRNIPSVVLIDEIDKADIDFPNDLLLLLDRFQFHVEEIDKPYTVDALQGGNRDERLKFLPIIIITSNREKALPMPFLRRCLYYHIKFPDQSTLGKIVEEHCKELTPLFQAAIKKFWDLREAIKWHKQPGTSELLDWIRILEKNNFKDQDITSAPINALPHLETLVKLNSDLRNLEKSKT